MGEARQRRLAVAAGLEDPGPSAPRSETTRRSLRRGFLLPAVVLVGEGDKQRVIPRTIRRQDLIQHEAWMATQIRGKREITQEERDQDVADGTRRNRILSKRARVRRATERGRVNAERQAAKIAKAAARATAAVTVDGKFVGMGDPATFEAEYHEDMPR